jgi:hypothetical protein
MNEQNDEDAMGAPRIDPDDETDLLTIRIPSVMLIRARREAKRRADGNLSALVRALLSQWLDEGATPVRARKRA